MVGMPWTSQPGYTCTLPAWEGGRLDGTRWQSKRSLFVFFLLFYCVLHLAIYDHSPLRRLKSWDLKGFRNDIRNISNMTGVNNTYGCH